MELVRHMFVNYDEVDVVLKVEAHENIGVCAMQFEGDEIEELSRDVRGAARPPGGDVGSGGPVEGPPAVWISASGDGRSGGGVVLRAVAAQLPDEVRDAAERGASYPGLGGRVQRAAVRGARVPRRRMAARSAWTGSSSGCSAVH